jgi:hypothetical protein
LLEYYLKLKLSCFQSGFTIPREYEECFIQNINIPNGNSRKISLKFKNEIFEANIIKANRNNNSYYALRWNNKFISLLKKEFIYSYITQMPKIDDKINKIRRRIKSKEVLKIKSLDPYNFELETFIKETTEFDDVFRRLIEEDFFGWLSNNDNTQIIVNTSEWFDISNLALHEEATYVIYYLIDEQKKELYIGSANRLGDRVKPKRHEIPGWNKFRYDIIHPGYKHLKQRIENHTINALARLLNNNIKGIDPFNISNYKLVNKTCYHK